MSKVNRDMYNPDFGEKIKREYEEMDDEADEIYVEVENENPYQDYMDFELDVTLIQTRHIKVSAKSLKSAIDYIQQIELDKIDLEKGNIDEYRKEIKLSKGANEEGDIMEDSDYTVPLWWYDNN